jgi:hypothetical protein
VAEYVLINLSPFEFRFVWAQHALLSTLSPVELKLQAGLPFRGRAGGEGSVASPGFEWPNGEGGEDFSCFSDLPAKQSWKIFSADPIASAATVAYPARNRQLTIEYASQHVPGYWGLWLNNGAWESHKHLAIEPTTGRCDTIDEATRDGTAGRIEPAGRCDWRTVWTCSDIG